RDIVGTSRTLAASVCGTDGRGSELCRRSAEDRRTRMDVTRALGDLGGVATHRDLTAVVTRHALTTAVAAGKVVRIAHGRYALPSATQGIPAAAYVGGVVALRSAAAAHGWPQKTQPPVPEVAVGRRSRRSAARRWEGVRLLWTDLEETEVVE